MKNNLLRVIVILTVIPFIIRLIINSRQKAKLRKMVLADGTDDYKGAAKNIANSISKGKALYKELIVKVHPDRFLDSRKEKASELSAKITLAKRNYSELVILKEQVDEFLKGSVS